jgi:hypothetical protein
MNNPALSLGTSERQTLRYIAEGQVDPRELDWLALQRLKRAGLIEERGTGPGITAEGRRANAAYQSRPLRLHSRASSP